MPPPANIPGYMFDPEKNKFFKIPKGHQANPGAASSHTETAIRKRRRDQSERVAKDTKAQLQASRISKLRLSERLLSPTWDLETGPLDRDRLRVHATDAWARGLERTGVWSQEGVTRGRGIGAEPQPLGTVSGAANGLTTSHLLVDHELGVVFKADVMGGLKTRSLVGHWLERYRHIERSPGEDGDDSDIVGMCLSSNRAILTVYRHAICRSSLFREVDMGSEHPWRDRRDENNRLTHFSVASNGSKLSETSTFAVGCNSGALMMHSLRDGHLDVSYKYGSSDVLALEWLNNSLLLCGMRNGELYLHDERARSGCLRGSHPSAVAHIKGVDETRFVVAGLEDKMMMYDLRWMAREPLVAGGKKRKNRDTWSKPYLHYAEYRNRAHTGLGFDVDVCAGLVAAATDDKRVFLLDLWSGNRVQAGWDFDRNESLEAGREKDSGRNRMNTQRGSVAYMERTWGELVRSLVFFGDKGVCRSRDKGIILGVGATVEEWT